MCSSKNNSLKCEITFREKMSMLDYFNAFYRNGYLNASGRKRRSSADDGVMDDCMAAMVLMSLSCSPKSPCLPITVDLQRGKSTLAQLKDRICSHSPISFRSTFPVINSRRTTAGACIAPLRDVVYPMSRPISC
ncbi:hypothetical protein NPIL_141651 [Nephila pilipes]|uniref:Uncharacterized protein n=1 Tax=Nephila pilipes TaxID=299642 RepID=A0A8X6IET4_NEPPI|nr:hypothetical protein NPIL_141651 [Nephila pilipes]